MNMHMYLQNTGAPKRFKKLIHMHNRYYTRTRLFQLYFLMIKIARINPVASDASLIYVRGHISTHMKKFLKTFGK
jgi:hypothetical protein